MILRQTRVLFLLFVSAFLTQAHAQFEVPNEIFQRTLLIRSGKEQATAFKFDQGGRVYLVTTRHFGKNLPRKNAVVQFWRNRAWNELQTVRTFFPASPDIDLAVLETSEQLATPYKVVRSEEVLTTGQPVWLLEGPILFKLPPEAAARMPKSYSPETTGISIGAITQIDPTLPDLFEVHFRGSYGHQQAGGPILYWSPAHQDYEIMGVIKRNKVEVTKPPVHENPATKTLYSGVVRGYSIDLVVEAIHDNAAR